MSEVGRGSKSKKAGKSKMTENGWCRRMQGFTGEEGCRERFEKSLYEKGLVIYQRVPENQVKRVLVSQEVFEWSCNGNQMVSCKIRSSYEAFKCIKNTNKDIDLVRKEEERSVDDENATVDIVYVDEVPCRLVCVD